MSSNFDPSVRCTAESIVNDGLCKDPLEQELLLEQKLLLQEHDEQEQELELQEQEIEHDDEQDDDEQDDDELELNNQLIFPVLSVLVPSQAIIALPPLASESLTST